MLGRGPLVPEDSMISLSLCALAALQAGDADLFPSYSRETGSCTEGVVVADVDLDGLPDAINVNSGLFPPPGGAVNPGVEIWAGTGDGDLANAPVYSP